MIKKWKWNKQSKVKKSDKFISTLKQTCFFFSAAAGSQQTIHYTDSNISMDSPVCQTPTTLYNSVLEYSKNLTAGWRSVGKIRCKYLDVVGGILNFCIGLRITKSAPAPSTHWHIILNKIRGRVFFVIYFYCSTGVHIKSDFGGARKVDLSHFIKDWAAVIYVM